jgi:hypothetical protein
MHLSKEPAEESLTIPSTATGRDAEGPDGPHRGPSKAREQQMRSTVHYVGFRSTEDGREYTLRASGTPPRMFVMLIAHEHFVAGQLRYQDGPDLCCAKLTRVLAEETGEPAPDGEFVVTAKELLEYHSSHAAPAVRKRAARS